MNWTPTRYKESRELELITQNSSKKNSKSGSGSSRVKIVIEDANDESLSEEDQKPKELRIAIDKIDENRVSGRNSDAHVLPPKRILKR